MRAQVLRLSRSPALRGRVVFACALLLGLLPACGGGGSIAEVDLLVTVSSGTTSVATGEGFPLTVTRIWRKDLEPSPWDDGVLSPLVVRAEETQRREDRLRVEEIRTFRAYAFTLDDVSIPPVLFVGRSIGGSGKLIARSEALPLRVRPVLDPQAAGVPEFPQVPLPLRPRWPGYVLLVSLSLLVAGYVLHRRRQGAAQALEATASGGDARARALARLTRLSAEAREPESVVTEIADILRQFVGVHYAVSVEEQTSEEVVAALSSAVGTPLRDLLQACDQVKFAHHRPSLSECVQVRSNAVAFVQACEERCA